MMQGSLLSRPGVAQMEAVGMPRAATMRGLDTGVVSQSSSIAAVVLPSPGWHSWLRRVPGFSASERAGVADNASAGRGDGGLDASRMAPVGSRWNIRRGLSEVTSNAFGGRAAAVLPSSTAAWSSQGGEEVAGRLGAGKRLGFGSGDTVSAGSGSGGVGARRWGIRAVEANSSSGTETESTIVQKATETLHMVVALGVFLAIDKFLEKRLLAAGIRFPSALLGMFWIFSFLNIAEAVKPEVASAVIGFFQPGIKFIQRWLPLFYVPSLVVVPLAVQGIPAAAAAKIGLILAGGWAASLAVAGTTAVAVRSMVKTEMQAAEYTPKAAPFADWEAKALAVAMVLSFALAIYSPLALGSAAVTVLPFFLFATALGYVFGSNLPAGVKKIFHPIITCAITADLAALVFGYVSKSGFEEALKLYLTKQAGNPGAGDVYMGFLGSVILSFAFSMFNQRKLVKRHAPEIFSAVVAAGVFSLYSTAVAGRLLGLPPNLTLAIVPRCITVALALPIAGLLEAGNSSLTAAVVVLTGLVGANFTQVVMDKLGFGDPISRGLATACSAHGLGTAALSAKEPEALPFCAIAYALTGIFCSLLVTVPAVQRSLIVLAGTGAL